jgi:hypothetical protein
MADEPEPQVEFLWWDGCPSADRALAIVRDQMAALRLDPAAVLVREVRTDEDASAERFVGSPTIRVDGRDVQPEEGQPVGLSCRVYRRRDGSVSPLPDPADVRDALAAALEGGRRG